MNVVDANGGPLSVFYPAVAEKPATIKFEFLKPGQKVGIEYLGSIAKTSGPVRAMTVNPVVVN